MADVFVELKDAAARDDATNALGIYGWGIEYLTPKAIKVQGAPVDRVRQILQAAFVRVAEVSAFSQEFDAVKVGQRVRVNEGEDAGSEARVVAVVSADRLVVELADGTNLSTRTSAVSAMEVSMGQNPYKAGDSVEFRSKGGAGPTRRGRVLSADSDDSAAMWVAYLDEPDKDEYVLPRDVVRKMEVSMDSFKRGDKVKSKHWGNTGKVVGATASTGTVTVEWQNGDVETLYPPELDDLQKMSVEMADGTENVQKMSFSDFSCPCGKTVRLDAAGAVPEHYRAQGSGICRGPIMMTKLNPV